MLNATRYAKAAISWLLFFGVSGYPLSIQRGYGGEQRFMPFSVDLSATSGYEMYTVYCAGCHGEDGRGKGRSSRYCTVPPVDLTQLARKTTTSTLQKVFVGSFVTAQGGHPKGRATCLYGDFS